jgi:hypothetical protein
MPAWREEIRLFGGGNIGSKGNASYRYCYATDRGRENSFYCHVHSTPN